MSNNTLDPTPFVSEVVVGNGDLRDWKQTLNGFQDHRSSGVCCIFRRWFNRFCRSWLRRRNGVGVGSR